jgi:hypothetical protein
MMLTEWRSFRWGEEEEEGDGMEATDRETMAAAARRTAVDVRFGARLSAASS